MLTCDGSDPKAVRETPFRNNRLIFSAVIRSDPGPMVPAVHVLMMTTTEK